MSNIRRNNKGYIGIIEVKPLQGCQLDPAQYDGAAVRVYIPAESFFKAQDVLTKSLTDNLFELIEIEMLVENNCVDWSNPNDEDAEQLLDEALECNEIIYGEFNAWNDEDDENDDKEFVW